MLGMILTKELYLHLSGKNKVAAENIFLWKDEKLSSGTSSSYGQEDFSFSGKRLRQALKK